jgi:putative membrane protein
VPGLVDLPLALVWIALALHLLGERRASIVLGRPRSREARWRAASFYAGLAVIFVALATPIDTLARKLFWVHMLQHVLLLSCAAPLLVLGAPWLSIWRPIPLGTRRAVAKSVARSPAFAPLRALGRLLSRPVPVWIVFNVNLVLWHLPSVYDATLRSTSLHALEHLTFLISGILLWSQVVRSPPLRIRLSAPGCVYYIVAATAVGWLLSLVLAFAPHALYPAYAAVSHRPGGISALADQQLAAGVMLGPGSLAATVYVFFGLFRWLGGDPDPTPRRASGRQYA